MLPEVTFMGTHSGKPKEDRFDTCRERNSICEREVFAMWGKKCAHDDFTLQI